MISSGRLRAEVAASSRALEPLLLDDDDPSARGRAHGEHWRDPIRELAALRLELCRQRGAFADDAEVLATALRHLPILRAQAPDLHDELCGIAEGAGVSTAAIIVLNHYTDLRDVPPVGAEDPDAAVRDDGGCTAIYTVGRDGPVLGQTWDMHASALPYVRMLRVAPRGSDSEVLCLTLAGCLGMAGMSGAGVAITINNLYSTDGRVGMIWPALVRAMLAQPSAAAAWELLRRTPLSSGHNYMIADGRDFFGVETSGELKVLMQTGGRAAHIHTNHCFDPVLRRREAISPANTTFHRLNLATTVYAQQRPDTADAVWDLLHTHDPGPGSLCIHEQPRQGASAPDPDQDPDPHGTLTCAVLSMRLRDGGIRVVKGCAERNTPLDLGVQRWRGRGDC